MQSWPYLRLVTRTEGAHTDGGANCLCTLRQRNDVGGGQSQGGDAAIIFSQLFLYILQRQKSHSHFQWCRSRSLASISRKKKTYCWGHWDHEILVHFTSSELQILFQNNRSHAKIVHQLIHIAVIPWMYYLSLLIEMLVLLGAPSLEEEKKRHNFSATLTVPHYISLIMRVDLQRQRIKDIKTRCAPPTWPSILYILIRPQLVLGFKSPASCTKDLALSLWPSSGWNRTAASDLRQTETR